MNERIPNSNGHNELHAEPDAAPVEGEANRERQPGLNPRIYVTRGLPLRAELTDGTWVDMARDPQTIRAEMFAVLAADEATEGSPLYIWDHDGFGAFDVTTGAIGLEGVDSIELLAQVARGIKEHGPEYAAYASAHEDELRLFDNFAAVYKGHHESLAAYARQLFEPLKIEEMLKRAVPEVLKGFAYIDYVAIGEEMLRGGDIAAIPAEGGGVWIFEERA
ncbi:antirestriction protein ArdA [Nocardia brasiliensis]|uniref:antirestriction protein ArdA n=1 Tax=Nocardia brasiliensis TaxID=37326 RepID=UPI0024567CDF|nr:antirestriction protein ArdA [Nocardia brasiliensis]